VLPAQQQLGPVWYRGTADAVHQNIELIASHRPKHVLVLAGDHIYKMDYGPMIAYHVEKGADITVGVVEVPASESRSYGVLTTTEWNRVTRFAEKPAVPDTLPARPDAILASMGIYVFNMQLLQELLAADAASESSAHDFGKDVLPEAIAAGRQVFAYPFQDVKTRAQSYWRDVGTIDAYYDANLELVHVRPELNIYDHDWPIWTYQVQQPPAKFVLDEDGRRGTAINSMISGGCIVSGAVVRESLMFSNVRIEERSSVYRSMLLPNAEVGRGCVINNAIVDEGCEIPDGMQIGVDRAADAGRFHVTEKGVVLVTPDMLRQLPRG
jgi:glucose-1-phosphate adenylyltransferase